MKKKVEFIVSLLFLFMLIFSLSLIILPLTSASSTIGSPNHSINSIYGKNENISGWVNLSFNNEPGISLFKDLRENSISLIDVLKKDSRHIYSCIPLDCKPDYAVGSGSSSKTTNLGTGASKTYGLSLTGNIESINSVDFNVESDAPISGKSQINIDLFNDGNIDFINNKTCQGTGCSNVKSYGCYISGPTIEEYFVEDGRPFCQKINLSEAPGFSLGAWVKNVSGTRNLTIELYNNLGVKVAGCDLPEASSTIGAEVSCDVNYTVKKQEEYSVCLYPTAGSGTRVLKGYSVTNGCGFRQFPVTQTAPQAYQIFAESKKFDAPGTLTISNNLPDGNTLASKIQSYIQEKYGSLDCSSGCIVPIKLISTVNQAVTLKNLALIYRKDGSLTTQSNFYDVSENPASVTAGFQKIYIDNSGFSVPDSLGTYTFSFEFDSQKVFSEKINVSDVPRVLSLSPTATASAFPTEFTVGVSSPSKVEKYFWDFGDNKTEVTTENKATHTYSSTGTYQIKITVTDSRNLGNQRTFDINVSLPKDLINTTLKKMRNNLGNVTIQLAGLGTFTAESVNSTLRLINANSEISRLEASFVNATTEEEYNKIITDVLKLNIPNSVSEGNIAESISLFIDSQNINLGTLQSISGGSYGNQEQGYKNAIIYWNQQNLDTKVDYTEIVGEYETSTETVVRIFKIDISEKTPIAEDYFLVMPKLENLKFSQGVIIKETGNYIYIDIKNTGSIFFSTTENVDFTNLPAFISPPLSLLSITEINTGQQGNSKVTIFILALVFLAIIAFIVYLVLQQWYKKRYEAYLFKNRNDLYNLVTYINNAKKRGLKKSEIEENLKKSKWSSEQVRYALRKYAGKKTGMIELPFTDFIDKKIEKR